MCFDNLVIYILYLYDFRIYIQSIKKKYKTNTNKTIYDDFAISMKFHEKQCLEANNNNYKWEPKFKKRFFPNRLSCYFEVYTI